MQRVEPSPGVKRPSYFGGRGWREAGREAEESQPCGSRHALSGLSGLHALWLRVGHLLQNVLMGRGWGGLEVMAERPSVCHLFANKYEASVTIRLILLTFR